MERVTARLTVGGLRCPLFRAGERLTEFAVANVPKADVREGLILAVTSKIASLAEGRLVARGGVEKSALVAREADAVLSVTRFGVALTIKNGLLIPSAGIDESNSENGDFILYPQRPFEAAQALRLALREAWGLRDLGVLLTDSNVTPLRRGTIGVALAYAGFRGKQNLVGTRDLFGRKLTMTQVNLADGLAAAAVLAMGEGSERCPLAVLHGAPKVEFVDEVAEGELRVPLDEDLYGAVIASLSRKRS